MTDLWSQWDIILGVLSDVQEIFHDDGRARAALDCAHSLRSYAAAALTRAEQAERERDAAYIDAGLNESNRVAAWQRVAELEAVLGGDIQAVTGDGQQHRIRRGNWRPCPPAEEAR